MHGDYELNNTSWNHLQQKYRVSYDTVYTALKGKRRPGGSHYCQKRKRLKPETTASTSGQMNNSFCYILGIPFVTMILMYGIVLLGDILLTWATLQ